MYFQLTNVGAQRLKSDPNTAPTVYKLGDGMGYQPSPLDTDIHGKVVSTGGISIANRVNGNVLRYSVPLQNDLGPFSFGEMGLYTEDGALFALGVSDVYLSKVIGIQFRIDAYIMSAGTDYLGFLQVAEDSNGYRMGVKQSVDELPQGQDKDSQAFIITLYDTQSFRAFATGTGLWSFDEFSPYQQSQTVSSATTTSALVPTSLWPSDIVLDSDHPVLIQFASGFMYSTCRQLTSMVVTPNGIQVSWSTPTTQAALAGDFFYVYTSRTRQVMAGPGIQITQKGQGDIEIAATGDATIASTTQLGVVQVGSGLEVTEAGVLSVTATPVQAGVNTFNTLSGDVTYNVSSASTLGVSVLSSSTSSGAALRSLVAGSNVTLAVDQNGNVQINSVNQTAVIPVASSTTLGGVRTRTGNHVLVDPTTGILSLDFTPVTINGRDGAQTIMTTVADASTGQSLVSDSGQSTGVAKILAIKTGTGLTSSVVAGDLVLDTSFKQYVLPTATASTLGGVKIGANITVAADGTISAATPFSLPKATTTVLGGVIVGDNLTVDANGRLSASASYTLPTASTTVLGGIKVGSGLVIDATGTLALNYQSPVTSVNNKTGAVIISITSDNSKPGSQSLVAANGAANGRMTLKDLVAGSGMAIAVNSDGNIVLTSTSPVTSVNSLTGSVVVRAVDNSTATGVSLISDSGATTGNIKLLRLVAGSNVAITPDSSGNLQISSSAYVLPKATTSTLGGVIVGAGLLVDASGNIAVGAATASAVGGVKVGSNISVTADGTISVAAPYTLPAATSAALGGVKIGSNVNVAADGTISVTFPAAYVLPVATSAVLGGVKVGANVNVAADGTISVAAPYVLPVATTAVVGGVKAGTGLNVAADGTLSVNTSAVVTGYAKLDGTTGAVKAIAASGAFNASNGGGTGTTSITLTREGAPTDQKVWELFSGSDGSLAIRTANDAYTAFQNAVLVQRGTSTAISTVSLAPTAGRVLVGTITDDGTNELQVAGNVRMGAAFLTGFDAAGANLRIAPPTPASQGDFIFRNDGTNLNLLVATTSGQGQAWNTWRPLIVSSTTGRVTLDQSGEGGTTVGGTLNVAGDAQFAGNVTVVKQLNTTSIGASGAIVAAGSVGVFEATNGGGTGQTSIFLTRSGAPTDQKRWEIMQDGNGSFVVRTVNDTYTSAVPVIQATRGTGINPNTLQLLPSVGRITVGNTGDDGQTLLQVGGDMRANKYFIGTNGTGDSGVVGIYSDDNGPWLSFFGKATTDAGALTLNAGGFERMRVSSSGGVTIGTPLPANGGATLVVSTSTQIYNPTEDTALHFSTVPYQGGATIEAFNGANTTKKNLVLAPFGGRVLMGSGATDDSTSTLQVQGQASVNGTLWVSEANATYVANDTSAVNSARMLYSRASKTTWALNADFTSADQFTLVSYDDNGNPAHNILVANRATSAIQIPTRLSVGTFADDGVNVLQVVGNTSVLGSIIMPLPNTSVIVGSSTEAGQSAINFNTGAFGSGSAFDGRIVALNGTSGQIQTADMIYIGGSHQFRIGTGGNGLTINSSNRVLLGTATDDGSSQLQVAGNAAVSGNISSTSLRVSAQASGVTNIILTNASTSQPRWLIQKDNTSETGSQAGSSLSIIYWDDDNTTQHAVLTALRSNGCVAISRHLLIGTTVDDGVNSLQVSGPAKVNGPFTPGLYTLSTLPTASSYTNAVIMVTNATGGPKLCYSNGTSWLLINTSTVVS